MDDMTAVRHSLDGRTIKIYCIADVHLGDPLCDYVGIKSLIKQIENDPNAYAVLCGDIFNNAVMGSPSDVYNELVNPQDQLEAGVELFSPISEKLLGIVGGNHEARTKKQTSLDMTRIFSEFLGVGCRYRENICFVMIELARGPIHHTYNLALVHGKSENKKKQFVATLENVDCVVSGHTHCGLVSRPARLVLQKSGVAKIKPMVSVTATSWLNYGGYGAAALYQPVSTSSPAYIQLNWYNTNSKSGDITVVW